MEQNLSITVENILSWSKSWPNNTEDQSRGKTLSHQAPVGSKERTLRNCGRHRGYGHMCNITELFPTKPWLNSHEYIHAGDTLTRWRISLPKMKIIHPALKIQSGRMGITEGRTDRKILTISLSV